MAILWSVTTKTALVLEPKLIIVYEMPDLSTAIEYIMGISTTHYNFFGDENIFFGFIF